MPMLSAKKKTSHLQLLENERSFTLRILLNNFKMLIVLLCVPTPHIQNDRDIYPVRNRLFVGFSITLREHHMPLKVPKIKDSYISTRCSATTHSTCTVFGNISTHCTLSTTYPRASSTSRSRARLVGLHEI